MMSICRSLRPWAGIASVLQRAGKKFALQGLEERKVIMADVGQDVFEGLQVINVGRSVAGGEALHPKIAIREETGGEGFLDHGSGGDGFETHRRVFEIVSQE